MARTPFHIVKSWLLEALEQKGGRCGLHDLVEYLERVKQDSLVPDDHLIQKGHPKDTQFKYYCRWAITVLRDEGKIKRGSPRGIVELETSVTVPAENKATESSPTMIDENSTSLGHVPANRRVAMAGIQGQEKIGHQPWLRQELGKMLPEDRWDDVPPHEKTRLLQELDTRLVLSNPDRDESWRISMAKAIFKRVQDISAGRYPPKNRENSEKKYEEEPVNTGFRSYYGETCGELLEQYVREHFAYGEEFSRDEIATWIAEHYPKFKPASVQAYIQQYTTNYRSRAHYNARQEHDLLYRVNNDWNRLRLYQPRKDPAPIYKLEQSKTEKRFEQRQPITKNPVERHRSLLAHLSQFGELTDFEQRQLGIETQDLTAWMDSLMVFRPLGLAVSPLFLCITEGDADPISFTTRLAVRMTGDYLDRAAKNPMDSIEGYVWERFGRWHLPQPHVGEARWHGYLSVPVIEPANLAESEKLDLFSHLPPLVISELVRDSGFLSEQQTWSAQASIKGNNLGPLSRQISLGLLRPLFLSEFELTLDADAGIGLNSLPVSEILNRNYIVSGLPLCTVEEWRKNLQLTSADVAERILGHPLYSAIVQFEVHRITAKLSGEIAASMRQDPNGYLLEINGNVSTPLWLACRNILVDLGFWPAAISNKDDTWESAVRRAIANLEKLGVLEFRASELRLCDVFASNIKAHPAHPQNRGEKSFRVRLAQYFEKVSRGAS